MQIKSVTDASFKKYGRIVEQIDFSGLVEKLAETPCPQDVVYEPSIPELEQLPVFAELQSKAYGELPIQIGYCNGNNYKLNAVEYHRSSEINVAGTAAVLLVGWLPDVAADGTYDTSLVEASCCRRAWRSSCMRPRFTMRRATRTRTASAWRSCFRATPTCRWRRSTRAARTQGLRRKTNG